LFFGSGSETFGPRPHYARNWGNSRTARDNRHDLCDKLQNWQNRKKQDLPVFQQLA
jgi:hypothetical protein